MRRSGKTTRMIDQMVQHLFKKGRVIIPVRGLKKDWTGRGGYWSKFGDDAFFDPDADIHNTAQKCAANRFDKRLRLEHEGTFNFKKEPDYLIYTRKD